MQDDERISRKNLQDGIMQQADPSNMKAIYDFFRTRSSLNNLAMFLDIGCGDGSFLSTLNDGLGIELSKQLARRVCERKLPVVVADANFLPFRDEVFDLVTCIEVLEHTTTPYSVLHETHRVLKKRGGLFLSTPNLAGPIYALSQMMKRKPSPAHRIGFDPYLLSQALGLVNFKIINLAGVIVARSSVFLPLSWFCSRIPNLATCIIIEAKKES